MLAVYDLIGREEAKPAIWPPGYVTSSRVAEVGSYRLHAPSMQTKDWTVMLL